MKKLLLPTIAVFLFASANAQSGWVKAKNEYYLKLEYQSYKADKFHTIDGKVVTTSPFTENSVFIYNEYGLGKNWGINTTLPILKAHMYHTTNTVANIGDLRVELKYALLKKKFPVAISIAPELPTGAKNLFAMNKQSPNEKINIPTGDGELNVWTTVAVSHSFYPTPMYTSFHVAYNYRTKFEGVKFKNQFQSAFELGYKLNSSLWLSTRIYVLNSLGQQQQTSNFTRGDGTNFTSVAVQAAYEIGKRYAVSLQYSNSNSLIVKSKNNYQSNVLSIGVARSTKRK